jgi:hypothetical protein
LRQSWHWLESTVPKAVKGSAWFLSGPVQSHLNDEVARASPLYFVFLGPRQACNLFIVTYLGIISLLCFLEFLLSSKRILHRLLLSKSISYSIVCFVELLSKCIPQSIVYFLCLYIPQSFIYFLCLFPHSVSQKRINLVVMAPIHSLLEPRDSLHPAWGAPADFLSSNPDWVD